MSTLNPSCADVRPPVTCTEVAALNAALARVMISAAGRAPSSPDAVAGAAPELPGVLAAPGEGSSEQAAATSAAADTTSRTRNGRTERFPFSQDRKTQSTSPAARRHRQVGPGMAFAL